MLMRIKFVIYVTGVLLGYYCVASALDIVKDGKGVARIVVPDNADEYTKMAADWIQKYVKRGTGADLSIFEESKDQGSGPRICLGATKTAAEAGIRGDNIQWDGCRMVVKGNTLFLLGHDEPGVGKADHKAPKGTCRAAATFLEEFCGIRWFIPSPQGDFVPERKDIVVPGDLDKTVIPAFGYAIGRYIYGLKQPATYANNFRDSIRLYTAGGHTWPVWVPVSKYYKEHPEYFALISGQRCNSQANHLCTTNPDVKRLLLEGLRQKFDEGYDWAQLAQSDGYQRCECPACEALDNYRGYESTEKYIYETLRDNPCERILLLHREIAEECKKSHPNKTVHILVYGPTRWPSKKFDKFPDNVVLEICDQDPRVVAAWQGKARAFTAYVYYWGTYHAPGLAPKCTAEQVAEYLRYLHDNNFQGIYFCGAGECWGLEGHAYYACGKLLGNPHLDPKSLVEEYCNGVFGKAAPTMIRFFQTLDDRVRLYGLSQKKSVPIFKNAEFLYTTLYPPAVLGQLDALLRQAEALADDERSRGWIQLTRTTFDYIKFTSNVFTLYRAYQVNKSRASLAQLQQAVNLWRAHRDKILNLPKEQVAIWFPGWAAWQDFFKTGGHMHSVLRAPFDWDFERMMAQMASGTPRGPSYLVAGCLTQPPRIDGIVGDEEWHYATPVDVNLMMGGTGAVPTKVRVAFDDKNLYVAFTCSEPHLDKLRLGDQKRDGSIWNMDCVEIFFDPESTGTKYMHFIIAPAKGTFYDARKGYIMDPLHPLYGQEDRTWNPDWNYAFQVNAEKKEWTIEAVIPFASLGVTPPSAGTKWKANFGRERYAGLKDPRGEPELFLWSPNELGTGFCEPLCFGDIYFEKSPAK